MPNHALYDDGLVRLDQHGIILRHYYFPFGTSKHISYDQIRSVELRPMGWLTGRGRLWGTAHPRYWMPLDLGRMQKHEMLILDLGKAVRPAFTPADADRVARLIDQKLAAR